MTHFYTIGHSTLNFGAFTDLLKLHGVKLLVDVRAYPGSSHVPQFNSAELAEFLPIHGIGYKHISQLGGRRRPSKNPLPDVTWWTHPSFAAYAQHALTNPDFRQGLHELEALGAECPVAYMCAEAQWWRCHRRIISDWLTIRGHNVFHIMGPSAPKPHALASGAVADTTSITDWSQAGVRYPG